MAQPAQVTSVDALASFRTSLVLYLGKTRPVLEEISAEVARVRGWVEHDQRLFWENQLRQRRRKFEEAQEELFNARIALTKQSTALLHLKMQRAEKAVDDAQAKLNTLKKWSRQMENHTDPLLKQIEQLQGFLAGEMTRGAVHLDEIVKTLEAYAQSRPTLARPANTEGADGAETTGEATTP
ncbi:MAG: hypothetical protein U1F65_00435 [Verrucomicrobiota bacterium]